MSTQNPSNISNFEYSKKFKLLIKKMSVYGTVVTVSPRATVRYSEQTYCTVNISHGLIYLIICLLHGGGHQVLPLPSPTTVFYGPSPISHFGFLHLPLFLLLISHLPLFSLAHLPSPTFLGPIISHLPSPIYVLPPTCMRATCLRV